VRAVLENSKVEIRPTSRLALVTGDGRTLHRDLANFLVWKAPHDVISIGRSIKVYPGKVMHWANVDGADSKWWAEHLPGSPIRHTMGEQPWYDADWTIQDEYRVPWDDSWHGSSALFAALIALAMGYNRVVLAGCPMDVKGHWWQGEDKTPGPRWPGESYQAWFEFAALSDGARVRSLSGYTAAILGEPFREWVNE
jgi:hypothetical protein